MELMLNDEQHIKQQIGWVADALNLDDFVIEKDLYVTQAISIVNDVTNELYDLVFQGGTSLAKAHRIIERMSEDCDFRMRFKDPAGQCSKALQRRALRQFRHELIDALKRNGFTVDDHAIRVRNAGQFMGVRVNYPSLYPMTKSIKPFLALEFFLAEVKIPVEVKPVTTLIQQTLGDTIKHPEFSVPSVAIIETAAEKWVGLTRRVATCRHKKHYRDANLVRHLYDLYQINQRGYFSDTFYSLVSRIVLDDRQHYKNHNDDYYRDPIGEIKRAVEELYQSTAWRDHWNQFVDVMVFSQEKPSYDEVLSNLHEKTEIALQTLKNIDFSCKEKAVLL